MRRRDSESGDWVSILVLDATAVDAKRRQRRPLPTPRWRWTTSSQTTAERQALAMKETRSAAPMHHHQQRFCWRERTEKLNWRLLRSLHLPDVVKRGDPSVLEPYVLHLTFARLPASAATMDSADAFLRDSSSREGYAPSHGGGGSDDQQRNAWFIVRVFQLATEYLLSMRARDGTVLETLQQELLLCEKECEVFAARATKWKERARSGDKQVQKLHQVLQNIAKLLQLQGATPSAIETIESLLRNMLPRHKKDRGRSQSNHEDDESTQRKRIKEARQCYYCGKMFASSEFLDKHHLRRHAGESKEFRIAEPRHRKAVAAPQPAQEGSMLDGTPGSGEKALRQMLQQVEHALQDHQESLRSLAKQEARKIESIYEQLHVENQLAEEIKASRVVAENQVREAQAQLDTVLQEREDALTELTDLKEQIQFLDMRRKMESQAGVRLSSPAAGQHDMATVLEMKRLEQALAMVNAALSEARSELAKQQEMHLATLKDKQALLDQLSGSQNHVKRLENKISELSGTQSVPVVRKDCGSQTVASEARDASTQAENMQTESVAMAVQKAETGIQTHSEVKLAAGVDVAVQADPEEEQVRVVPPSAQLASPAEIKSVAVEVKVPSHPAEHAASPVADQSGDESAAVSDYVFNIVADNTMNAVVNRAQRAVEEFAMSARSPSAKRFSCLPGRKFLRSRHQHDEHAVQERIASQVLKLDQLAQRFGVPPKCSVLPNEHLQIVQQALHGHLEILPTDVLQRMIECESTVNSAIEKEWIPREKTRQQALERLKVETQAKSRLNQDLVKQAMVAFTTATGAGTGKQDAPELPVDRQLNSQPVAEIHQPPRCDENRRLETGVARRSPGEDTSTKEELGKPFSVKELTVIIEERPSLVKAATDRLDVLTTAEQPSDPAAEGAIEDRNHPDGPIAHEVAALEPPDADYTASASLIEMAPEPNLAVTEEKQPVAMKVVTVSPKSSSIKSETANATQQQEEDTVPRSRLVPGVDDKPCETASVHTLEIADDASTPRDAEIEVEAGDCVRVGAQSRPVDDVHIVSGCDDGDSKNDDRNGDPVPPAVSTSASTLPADETDDLEVVDIQTAPDAERSLGRSEFVMQRGVMDSSESVPADPRDRRSVIFDRGSREMSERRSYFSSEFSASMVASSELSFQASIPSLEESDSGVSEMDGSRSVDEAQAAEANASPRAIDSVESLASEQPMQSRYIGNESLNRDEHDDDATAFEDTGKHSDASNGTTSQQDLPSSHGLRYERSANTSVLNFSDNDDSEIEEVELA